MENKSDVEPSFLQAWVASWKQLEGCQNTHSTHTTLDETRDRLFLDNAIAPPSECEVASFHQPRCLRGTLARILTPDGRTQSSAYAQEMGKLHSRKEMMKDYAGEGNMLQFRIVS